MERYLAIKKNEILPFATTWMELECIMLSEISQSEKDRYHMIHLYVEFQKLNRRSYGKGRKNKIQTEREANHKRLLNTENKLRVAGGEVGGGMG